MERRSVQEDADMQDAAVPRLDGECSNGACENHMATCSLVRVKPSTYRDKLSFNSSWVGLEGFPEVWSRRREAKALRPDCNCEPMHLAHRALPSSPNGCGATPFLLPIIA